MPWSTSNRRTRLPADWTLRREAIRARALGRCEAVCNGIRCHRPGSEAHHAGAVDDHDDLVWLCADCHKVITLQEAARGRARMQSKARRPRERHPSEG